MAEADSSRLSEYFSQAGAAIISPLLHSSEQNENGDPIDSIAHISLGFHGHFFVRRHNSDKVYRCFIAPAVGIVSEKSSGYELFVREK
jgi:hypothetical protein